MGDKDIIKLYFERNEQAICETSAKYGNYCKSISLNIVGNYEDAEECVNDTYLGAWKSIPPHKPAVLSAFLGKIVRNLSFNKYKAIHAQKRIGNEFSAVLDELCEIVSDKENAEDEVIMKEMVSDINQFLDSLSEEKRYIFIRRCFYADSIKQIAKNCKRNENYISVELSRTRHKLKEHLTKRGYEL